MSETRTKTHSALVVSTRLGLLFHTAQEAVRLKQAYPESRVYLEHNDLVIGVRNDDSAEALDSRWSQKHEERYRGRKILREEGKLTWP